MRNSRIEARYKAQCNPRKQTMNENYGKALKYFAAETALTEGEIINIAARDDDINVPAEELDVGELGDVLARHKADILQQRKFRAMNAQRSAGVIAAQAIENVAAGTYLTESQLAHIVDKYKRLDLGVFNESKLIELAIDELQKYSNKLNEGWIAVSDSNSRLDEGWIAVSDSNSRLDEGWIAVGDSNSRLDEGWIAVGDVSKPLNEGTKHRFKNSRREKLNESKDSTNVVMQSLTERQQNSKNHNLDISKTNRFVVPAHMV